MVIDRIAQLVEDWGNTSLSPDLEHHGTRAVLDWSAATIAGSTMEPATLLEKALSEELDDGSATLVPSGRSATARAAALLNATAAHTAEVDDIFRDGIYHPGCPTIGAALACGETAGVTGETFVKAVAIGYEVGTRIAAAINPRHYAFWHTTGTVGTIGAAVAAAVTLGADREQVSNAVATAATFSSGLQQAFRSDAMSKPLHAGHAADVGVLAASGAMNGVTGAHDVLDGAAGFAAAMADGADLSPAFSDPELRNISRMTFKAHAACGHTFAAIDAALRLRADHEIEPARVEGIDVSTYATALEVAGNPNPSSPFEAKFSLAYTIAAALTFGSVQLDSFTQEAGDDPDLRRLVSVVQQSVDPEIDALFPGQRAAHVRIRLHDGRVVEHFAPTRRGDPEAPLTDAELEAKFTGLTASVVGGDRAKRIAGEIWSLPERPSLKGIWS